MAYRNRYVVKNENGGWDVVKEGNRRASARTKTKTEAIKAAKVLTRREGGGEVRILGRTGKIAASDTVPARRSASRTRPR